TVSAGFRSAFTARPWWAATCRGRSASPFWHQGDGAAPGGTGALDLDGQAGDVEAVGPGELVQVGRLLNLAILPRDPGEVGRRDVPAVAGASVVRGHVREGSVQGVGVDADHLDLLPVQPEDALPAQARLREVVRRPQPLVRPGVQQHDVEGPQRVA